jgi:hypothetical protein
VAWVKNDDRMDDTPKVKRAWREERASIGLWAMAKTCTARHEDDGLVRLEWVEEKLPDVDERERVLRVLCERELFELLPAGETRATRVREVRVKYGPLDEDAYIVHDYLEFNEARQEAEERRAKEAKRKAEAREAARLARDARDSMRSPAGQPQDNRGSPINV